MSIPIAYSPLTQRAVDLLTQLIAIPSISRDEARAADCLQDYMLRAGLQVCRSGNNLWSIGPTSDCRPTLLLNAHIDTVRPVAGWQHDPYVPTLEGDTLFGLGSNDDGASLVSLLHVFISLTRRADVDSLPYNLVFLASCEEEVSGRGGVESVITKLPHIDVAIVGEPTGMQPATAEKGLMVVDVTATGRSGHAARDEGINAIYRALPDIEWLRTCQLERVSPLLGAVKLSVTVINAGTQHNVVPDRCTFTVDVRTNELYTNEEVLEYLQAHLQGQAVARSTRLSSSRIDPGHPLVQRAVGLGLKPFGSPTLSDQALMPWPSMKIGPGQSSRSHTADEHIHIGEIDEAITVYTQLIANNE